MGRKRGSRRSSQAQRGVEGETVAAALRWRGCGCARRVREREEAEERYKGEGESEGVQGGRGGAEETTRGVAVARRCRRAGWWRGELGRVRRVPPMPTGARRKATGRVAVAGWAAGGAGPGKWAPGKSRWVLSLFLSLFYFLQLVLI